MKACDPRRKPVEHTHETMSSPHGEAMPKHFLAGRDLDLEDFGSLIERQGSGAYERSLIYAGLRGLGSHCTSLFTG